MMQGLSRSLRSWCGAQRVVFSLNRRRRTVAVLNGCFNLNHRHVLRSSFSTSRIASTSEHILRFEDFDLNDSDCNLPPHIAEKVGTDLHLKQNHPLNTIKTIIESYWNEREDEMKCFDDLPVVVSVHDNFDSLLIPPDHVSRQKSDTYYMDPQTVMRCHTSAHQSVLLKQGLSQFVVTGDVYRRDEIDATHYPVFHQMEGVKILKGASVEEVEADLKSGLEGMARKLFGNDVEMRWNEDYFPFTHPSFELEIFYNETWMEVLGCGVMQEQILSDAGRDVSVERGWAFGLGLERLAMILFQIPDIRLFWSTDKRFHDQFTSSEIIQFQPFSKYPPCFKDITFWLTPHFHPNDFAELVREVAGDLVEKVEVIDDFTHPRTERRSNCFRITYRSMERSLTNEEIDVLQDHVRHLTAERLGVELR